MLQGVSPIPIQAIRTRALSLWQRLMNYGRRNQLPFSEGNAVRPRFRGAQILDSVRTLIDGARATIHFEMYAWADDATGRDLLARVLAARARGGQV